MIFLHRVQIIQTIAMKRNTSRLCKEIAKTHVNFVMVGIQ